MVRSQKHEKPTSCDSPKGIKPSQSISDSRSLPGPQNHSERPVPRSPAVVDRFKERLLPDETSSLVASIPLPTLQRPNLHINCDLLWSELPLIWTSLLEPVFATLRAWKINASRYIDDILGSSCSSLAQEEVLLTCRLLTRAGLVINTIKSSLRGGRVVSDRTQ